MPATSTAVNACGVRILIDDEHGQLADVSGSANEFNLEFSKELGEFKVFGSGSYNRIECGEDAQLDITVLFTKATREGFDILKRWQVLKGKRTIRVEVPQAGDAWQGEYFLEKFPIGGKADDAKPIMVKATFKPDGEVGYQALV
jgi:hypothetical protein